MIQLISVFIRQYVVTFLGAFVRFIIDHLLRNPNRKKGFKSYRNYSEDRTQVFIDGVFGTLFLMILIAILVPILRLF